ncbi:hypothetical protein AB0L05_27735 [Nonomuraea pusilla]|uniref:hypothetical protein n=1 Tax=Nonomuraea pusilla TaxID=46177 RepID=UPI00332CBB00
MAYLPASSRERLRVPYGQAQDVTGYSVEIAIVPEASGEPGDADYQPAAWDGRDAVLMVGAGTGVVLAPGEYVVWTRLTAGVERPVRRSGVLTVGTP